MVRVSRGSRPSSGYATLREDPTIDRAYRTVARGAAVTADVYLRRRGNVCRASDKRPADLVRMKSEDRRDFLTDLVSSMESKGLSGGYIESTLKALRSWLSFNNVLW